MNNQILFLISLYLILKNLYGFKGLAAHAAIVFILNRRLTVGEKGPERGSY